MPFCFAASITSVPGAALIALPSMVRLTGSGMDFRSLTVAARFIGARPVVQVRFELVAELFDEGDGGHGSGVAEWTEGAAEHILRKLAHERDVAFAAHAVVHALQNLAQPGGAFAAGDAPAAALVRV